METQKALLLEYYPIYPIQLTTCTCLQNVHQQLPKGFIRTHALLAEPASKAPKRQDEFGANTSNPMAARAAEHNGIQVDHE